MASNEYSAVERTFRMAIDLLSKAAVDLGTFGMDLAGAGFLERDSATIITQSLAKTNIEKARSLIEIVNIQVKHSPEKLHTYLEFLEGYRSLHPILKATREEYAKLHNPESPQESPKVYSKSEYGRLEKRMKQAEQTKKAEMKKMKREMAERDEEIKMLHGELEELRDEMNDLTKRKQLMEEELEEKKRDEDQYKEKIKELQSVIEDLKEKLERNTVDFTSLYSNLLQKLKIKAEVSDKLRLVMKDIQKVQDEISNSLASEDIEKQLQMSDRNSYIQVMSNLKSKEKDIQGYKQRLVQVEEEINRLEKEVKEREEIVSRLEHQTKSQLKELQYNLITEEVREANELQNTLTEAKYEKQTTERYISNAEETINSLKRRIKENLEANPTKCVAEGLGTRAARINSKAFFTITIRDRNNRPCSIHPPCEPTVTMRSLTDQSFVETTQKSKSEATYEVQYTATQRGRHQLTVAVNGEEIQGSPFTVFVRKCPKQFLRHAKIISKVRLNCPEAIAITRDSEIVVCEQEGHKVSIITKSGEKIREFGKMGQGEGEFQRPCGVAVDDDHIFVADEGNNRIQKFTRDGRFVKLVGGIKGFGNREFNSPRSLKLHDGKIYVCDTFNCRIQVFDTELQLLSSDCRQFSKSRRYMSMDTAYLDADLEPWDIGFDNDSNWYIADRAHDRITVIDQNGNTLVQELIGLPVPKIHVDFDLIYISEYGKNRVSSYDISGVVSTTQAEAESPSCKFVCRLGMWDIKRNLKGVTVDDDGTVYICDSLNNCIVYFE